jgi:signal transduction histidine kinase
MAAAVPVPSPPWRVVATAAIILTHPSARSVGHGATAEAPSGVWFSLILLVLTLVALILWMHRRQQLLTVAAEQDRRVLVERMKSQEADRLRQREEAAAAEREQALLSERQRLMQDMHDGLGSALLSAMVAVEHGSMERADIVDVLRECVDDLRLVIDSLEPVGHDLMALLATMRYRLGKRLMASGLTLDWDVHDLPVLEWLEPPDALHVLRTMQEALNNVLKHARASRVRIVTRHLGRHVEIRVEDDGQGFDPETIQRGRGLKSQQRRAELLGGIVTIETTPGEGTRLSLRLPVVRRPRNAKADTS